MRNKRVGLKNKGFTLIELLVVTAVIGVLGIISASLISSIIRTQNKTAIINEVRQNGDLVISKIERDIKQSESVEVLSANGVRLNLYAGSPVDWTCDTAAGSFERAGVSVINTDEDNGVWVSACAFTVNPSAWTSGSTQIVTLRFTLQQRSSVLRSEYQVNETFQVTAGTRAY